MFDTKVIPPDAKKSAVHDAVGVSWEVADDPAVRQYGNDLKMSTYLFFHVLRNDKSIQFTVIKWLLFRDFLC